MITEDLDQSLSTCTEDQSKADDDGEGDDGKNQQKKELKKTAKVIFVVTILIISMGAAASGCFLWGGINSAKDLEKDRFDRHAHDLTVGIEASWRDYERAAQWIHEACRDWRDGSFSRADFRVLYNYLIAGGLDFFLAEWVPNITQEERPFLEAETAAYYSNDAEVDYKGFVGIEPNPANPEEFGLFPRSEHPFYFPIHFLEPHERIGEAAHLDLFSIIYERTAIETAIRKFETVLTERFVIVSQETHGYSVSLIHPGVPLPGDIYAEPKDVSLMLIHIRSLLARAARFQRVSLAAYIYDSTQSKADGSAAQFLGGVKIKTGETAGDENEITYIPEIELKDVWTEADLWYEETLEVGTRTWRVAVVPVDDSYAPELLISIVGSVMIFASASLVAWIWIAHNKKSSHQVKQIINKAAAESAIVSSLFPSAVRDRLIQENAVSKNTPECPPSTHDDVSLKNNDAMQGKTTSITSAGIYGSAPIAEFYENATIMFADLAGFTAWASGKTPTQVFSLLETIYHAFDMIALKRRVFKVETIGDCYVAVTGLPTRRKDHAVIASRFASDCLHKMNEITKSLETTFGAGHLGFRVGLHSGSVTGGVLRGEKGRFQLFGDTVNTASRMESTGVTNKIQVSQATADLLIAAGLETWLTPREDRVFAKGKGELQTYFVTPTKHTHASSHVYADSCCSSASNQSNGGVDEEAGGVDLEPSDVEKLNESLEHPSEEVGVVDLEPCDAEKTEKDLEHLGERLSTHLNRNCQTHFL